MRVNIDLTQGKIKNNVFFTSDFHLFHKNVIRFDNRPFNDVEEMHHVIETSWNETVNKNDTVIYLGDLSFARREDSQKRCISLIDILILLILDGHILKTIKIIY